MDQVKMGNPTLCIEQLTSNCLPDQFIRELTLNAVQAIERGGTGNTVEVYIDPYYLKLLDTNKLAFANNGIGMNAVELRSSLDLFCNESGQSTNFGVGAKIAVLARSHRHPWGLEYRTWKDWKCTVGRMRYPDGKIEIIEDPPESHSRGFKPDFIKGNGTVAVVLGNSDKDNTVERPEGSTLREGVYWLVQCVNSKFDSFPNNVKVRVMELPSPKNKVGTMRTAHGFRHYVDLCPVKHGTVELMKSGFTARWAVLPVPAKGESRQISNFTSFKYGQTCVLHDGEYYNVESGMSALRRFGVCAGSSQIAIILEPHQPEKYGANIARSSLERRVGGSKRPIPLDDIGEEFAHLMPKGLKDFIGSLAGKNRKHNNAAFDARLYEVHGNIFYIGKGKESVPCEKGLQTGVPKGTIGGAEDANRPGGSRPDKPLPVKEGYVPTNKPGAKCEPGSKMQGLPPLTVEPTLDWDNNKEYCTFYDGRQVKEVWTNNKWYGIAQLEQVIAKTTQFKHGEHTRSVITYHLDRHIRDIVYSAMEFRDQGLITEAEFKGMVSNTSLTSAASCRVVLLPGIIQSLEKRAYAGDGSVSSEAEA